jgi:hypothetical protein
VGHFTKRCFKDQFVEDDFRNTYAENFYMIFYTTAHPCASGVGNLAHKIGILHTNPELLYIPKHKNLGEFNNEFGNELYL